MARTTLSLIVLLILLLTLAGCNSPDTRPAEGAAPPARSTDVAPSATVLPPPPATQPPANPAGILIEAGGPGIPFDRRLLGTNVPAWIGPNNLDQARLQDRIGTIGPTLIRLPGGSWSNYYDWLACETRDESACYWPWAARPTDFLNFLRATGQEAMWTVSINGTAQEAAALVAFFNGSVDDERVIGTDVRGRDWRTIGHWARLRAQGGNPEPLPLRLWEVGNEVFGGKEGLGTDCSSAGWEDVWTCDGTEYVFGIGSGTERREGYLEFREAMRAVDPDILVGAVGVAGLAEWSNWGNEVIQAAGEDLDLYIVHMYAFYSEPPSAESVLPLPQQLWPRMMRELNSAFERQLGRRVPVAVTEYNLVAWQDHDNAQLMRRMVNALFVADSIGQMGVSGVSMANQWNLANGIAENGTDYGLVDSTSFAPNPQYYALAIWQRFGDELLPVTTEFRADRTLSVYAGRSADGTISLLAINKTGEPLTTTAYIEGVSGPLAGLRDVIAAESLKSPLIYFNGIPNPSDDLAQLPSATVGPFSGEFELTFDPYSITLLRLAPEP